MKEIYKALSNFQQEVPVILKDTEGYGYTYSDLPAILKVINPILKKNELGFYQAINGSKMKTVLFHIETGQTIESETDMPFDTLVYEEVEKYDKYSKQYIKSNVIKGFEGMNRAQAIGSIITYFRRYSLSSLLGIVTDKDTDGNGTIQKEVPVIAKKIIENARTGKPSSIKDFQEAFTDQKTGEIVYDEKYHELNEAKKAFKRDSSKKTKMSDSVFSLTMDVIQKEQNQDKLVEIKEKIKTNTVMNIEQKEQLLKIIEPKIWKAKK